MVGEQRQWEVVQRGPDYAVPTEVTPPAQLMFRDAMEAVAKQGAVIGLLQTRLHYVRRPVPVHDYVERKIEGDRSLLVGDLQALAQTIHDNTEDIAYLIDSLEI